LSDPIYERRGDFDNSRLHEALIFSIDGRRVGVFKSHHPDRIGVVLPCPDGGAIAGTITPQQFIDALESALRVGAAAQSQENSK